MNNPSSLIWSDVWFLVALYRCSPTEPLALRDVIASADAIEHAVMNFEEISSALVRLTQQGLIHVEPGSLRVSCTPRTRNVIAGISMGSDTTAITCKLVEDKLGVVPWSPGESLPNPENVLRYPGLSEHVYGSEVKAYLDRMQSG